MSNFDFSNLGPDLILDAIESIGIYPESGLLALNSYENRVYQFKADDNLRYVVKFYRPNRWTDEQILEEHTYSYDLLEHDVPLVVPITINGKTLFEFNGYRFCLYKSVGGRMFELDNLDQLEWLGRLLGKLHKASSSSLFTSRATINIEQELLESTEVIKQVNFIPSYLQNTFFSDLALLTERTLKHANTNYQTIKLHGDCHAGNILWQSHDAKSDAILVDFDDCLNGPAVQDIWMMLNGDRQEKLMQLDVMINAYEEFHKFNHAEFSLIEPLRARRMVNYMAWISKRWSDPAFPRNFSWFATDKYWEQQILAMKEQIAALNESTLTLFP
jgi:Ser/Thr protein kinase RdoA (MazF antagonist)